MGCRRGGPGTRRRRGPRSVRAERPVPHIVGTDQAGVQAAVPEGGARAGPGPAEHGRAGAGDERVPGDARAAPRRRARVFGKRRGRDGRDVGVPGASETGERDGDAKHGAREPPGFAR